jgi:hypothetical protein
MSWMGSSSASPVRSRSCRREQPSQTSAGQAAVNRTRRCPPRRPRSRPAPAWDARRRTGSEQRKCAAIAANGDILRDAEPVLLACAGAAAVVSLLSAGIARLPAMPPPNVYRKRARGRILSNCPQTGHGSAPGTPPSPAGVRESIRLGRGLGKAIRNSENYLRRLGPETSVETAMASILKHWRLRNGLARYRMHRKSSWLSFSILWLFIASVFAGAGALL